MLLAIDIGNTNITVGIFRGEILLGNFSKNLNEIVDDWENVIFEFAETFGIEYPKSKQKE